MKKNIFITGLTIILMILLSAPAMAQGGRIQFGNLKVVPGVGLQGVYDDNIYLGNGNNNTTELEEEDWITHITPSILLDYTIGGRGSLLLGYNGDLAYYDDNDQNDWKTHTGFLSFNYNAPGGLILGIDNTYIDAEDPYGSLNEYDLGIPSERWSNNLKTKIGYSFGSNLMVLVYYNYYKQDYDYIGDYTQNYDENEFGAGIQMKVLPKTWGFVRYHVGERDFNTHPAGTGSTDANDSDHDWRRVNMGLTWDNEAKFSGELNVGYRWKDYDNIVDKIGRRYDEKDT